MAITNGYGTLQGYKDRFGIEDTKDDLVIEATITATSRLIDELSWQRFYTTASDETRYFTASHGDYLNPGLPIVSITTLKTDRDGDRTYETTWATTDYDLMPFNATLNGKPYDWIQVTPNGDNSFPKIAKGVEIAGKFGWSSTPDTVVQACYLGAHRLMKRLDTPLGVSAAAALGQLQVKVESLRTDPEFLALVNIEKRQY